MASTYTWTVHFTSTDPQAMLPADYGINNAGQIVGWADICVNSNNNARAFIWQNGVMTALDTSTDPSDGSAAFAINDHGDVAGHISTLSNGTQPVIWKGGTAAGATTLQTLTWSPTIVCQGEAFAINDSGQAAGFILGPRQYGYTQTSDWHRPVGEKIWPRKSFWSPESLGRGTQMPSPSPDSFSC